MMRTLRFVLLCLVLAGTYTAARGQEGYTRQVSTFTLKEAIRYALEHNVEVANAQIDTKIADNRVGEIRAVGLPQLNANVAIRGYPIVPRAFLPAELAGGEPGTFVPVVFQPRYVGEAGLQLNQLIFDGSYFVGLRAASTYKQLAQRENTRTRLQVVEAVTKAYYAVLVNEERLNLLDANLARLDSLYRETMAMYQSGFAEKIDADRIEVSLNNLRSDKQRAGRGVELTRAMLKFQMGMPVEQPVTLTDRLVNVEPSLQATMQGMPAVDFNQRIEYSILQTQRELASLDIRNYRMGYYPRLMFGGGFGFNSGSNTFNFYRIAGPNSVWFENANLGVTLSIPVFDGLQKYYQIQQAKLTLQKIDQSFKQVENSINLQVQQARINLANGLESMQVQRRNLQLAEEVVRVSRIKFQEGVGSNLEVTNAESDLRAAQTNYYNALYDAIIAQVDLQLATGQLQP
jgi:outer membrane protein